MPFEMPIYHEPDFVCLGIDGAPDVRLESAPKDGVAPRGYHSTSMFPEYLRVGGEWRLVPESRMDSSIVVRPDGTIDVVENRNLRAGDAVVIGRTEDGSEGIYVHSCGFETEDSASSDQFAFRQGRSRETAYSRDYDRLMDLLRYEHENGGNVLWVMGPAFSFDYDARRSMKALIENGYVDGVLAGNALATHDLEGAYLHTALGQDIYTQRSVPLGHYNHLDVLNEVRAAGSIKAFIEENDLNDGIMCALERKGVPYVLTGSIRDDGPLPEVYANNYEGQDAMRSLVRKATTVICMATMLHTIATGNMTPSYRVLEDGTVRPVFLYAVDMAEFVVNKLLDRGSLSATTIVANVQDFITIIAKGLGVIK